MSASIFTGAAPAPGDMAQLPASLAEATRRARMSLVVMVGCVLLIGLVVPWLANAYWIKTLTSSLALSIAAAGVALLYGQLGLVSLCQYALLGGGGWIALRAGHGLGWPFELSVLAGGLLSCVVGMLAGLPALRLKGLYLALVTMMMAGGFQVVINVMGFPDGGAGWLGRVFGSERLMMPRPALALSDAAYFRYVAVWLAAVLALIELHRRTRAGRSWALIRRGEAAAVAAGVNILRYQTWAFGLAGFCAGVAGALLAGGVGQLDGRAFTAGDSVMLFALTVVGGVYHWAGALIAGLLLRAVPALLTDFGVNGYLAMIFFGVALLHALITAPSGIAGAAGGGVRGGAQALRAWRRQRQRREEGGGPMIRVSDLTVAFGGVKAIDGLSAELDAPVCGLIGPNGAGKTTLVNVLSGLVLPSAGSVAVDGADLLDLKPIERVRFGLRRSFQTEQVVEDLSVWDNVRALLDHVPHARGEAVAQVARALSHTGLLDVAAVPGHRLNLFQRRMLEIAKSLVGAPRLLLLDEPGAGLTEQEAGALRRVIGSVHTFCGAQVLLIDHDVDLIAATCTQTLVLDFGRRLALGPTRAVLDDPAVRKAYLGTE